MDFFGSYHLDKPMSRVILLKLDGGKADSHGVPNTEPALASNLSIAGTLLVNTVEKSQGFLLIWFRSPAKLWVVYPPKWDDDDDASGLLTVLLLVVAQPLTNGVFHAELLKRFRAARMVCG